MTNVDSAELKKFADFAHHWWDEKGPMRALHQINPLRVAWLESHIGGFKDKKIVDIGCGGGLLSEAMAQKGGKVTGIDASAELLDIAELHLLESGLTVDYQNIRAEELAEKTPESFDLVTCFEMLEHVPQPALIVQNCAKLIKRGGFVAFATLNRTFKSYLFAILGAEYVLKWLPRGTHAIDKFIKPAELARFAESAGLEVKNLQGLSYQIPSQSFHLSQDLSVNYFLLAQKT